MEQEIYYGVIPESRLETEIQNTVASFALEGIVITKEEQIGMMQLLKGQITKEQYVEQFGG